MAGGNGKIWLILFMVLAIPGSLALIFFLQAGFIFIILGLMPALVAYFVDGYTGKPTFKCVLFCNMSGMLPTFNDVLRSESAAATMQNLMGDGYTWFLVYGGAMCGYGLLLFARVFTQIALTVADQTRVEMLTKKQEQLTEEWGEDVKSRQMQPSVVSG